MSTERIVHNHGPSEAPGLRCRERMVDGYLVGDCLAATPATFESCMTCGLEEGSAIHHQTRYGPIKEAHAFVAPSPSEPALADTIVCVTTTLGNESGAPAGDPAFTELLDAFADAILDSDWGIGGKLAARAAIEAEYGQMVCARNVIADLYRELQGTVATLEAHLADVQAAMHTYRRSAEELRVRVETLTGDRQYADALIAAWHGSQDDGPCQCVFCTRYRSALGSQGGGT